VLEVQLLKEVELLAVMAGLVGFAAAFEAEEAEAGGAGGVADLVAGGEGVDRLGGWVGVLEDVGGEEAGDEAEAEGGE
jgi:hypothetical protein